MEGVVYFRRGCSGFYRAFNSPRFVSAPKRPQQPSGPRFQSVFKCLIGVTWFLSGICKTSSFFRCYRTAGRALPRGFFPFELDELAAAFYRVESFRDSRDSRLSTVLADPVSRCNCGSPRRCTETPPHERRDAFPLKLPFYAGRILRLYARCVTQMSGVECI